MNIPRKYFVERLKEYIKSEIIKSINEQKDLNDSSNACSYMQGIESALISLDEKFDLEVNENLVIEKIGREKEFSEISAAFQLVRFVLYVRNNLPSRAYKENLSKKDQRYLLRTAIWLLIKELFVGRYK